MTEYTPSFERILRLTATRSMECRDSTFFEIDPQVSGAEVEVPNRVVQAEWGDIAEVKVFSSIADEGGRETVLPLADGSEVEIIEVGRLNVCRNAGPFERHYLDKTGLVYKGEGNSYQLIGEAEVQLLVDELEVI